MKVSLYDIKNNYLQLIDAFANQEEINEEQLSLINNLEDALEEKAINIASIIKNFEAEERAVREAIENMKHRLEVVKRKNEALENYLRINMEQCGIKEISCPYFKIRIKKNPPSLLVVDESKIPEDFFEERKEIVLKRDKLKKALLEGIEIDGADVIHKNRLEIK